MRVRITELMAAKGSPVTTPYQLAKLFKARELSPRTAYRLAAVDGRVERLDLRMAEALCDIFDVDVSELLERDKKAGRHR